MGKVGTAWIRAKSAEIRKALDTVVSFKQKLTRPIRKAQGHMDRAGVLCRGRTGISPQKDYCGPAHSRG